MKLDTCSSSARSFSTSAAMSIVWDDDPLPPCFACVPSMAICMPSTIGILDMGGVWSLPSQALRQAFICSISEAWVRRMSDAIWRISGRCERCSAIRAISTAPSWWGTIMSMNC